ncbi:hypothetical protein KR093_009027, partial [Drosophila rubida]
AKMKRNLLDFYEPVAKRTRLQLRQSRAIMMRLTDLPSGPMRLIFSKLDVRSRHLLADASPELNAEHIEYMLHEYKSLLHYQFNVKTREPNNISSTMELNIITHNACNYYVSAGHLQSLARTVSDLFTNKYDRVNIWSMQRFLHNFYTHLERESVPEDWPCNAADRMRLHHLRLLNMVTLLNLFRQFREFHLIESRMNLMHWQLHIEIWGIHIAGSNTNWLTQDPSEVDKLNDLSTLVAELLVYDMSDMANSHTITIGDMAYNLGITRRPLTRRTRLELKFVILAPVTVRNLLEDVMAGIVPTSKALNCAPFDAFSIQLDLKSYSSQHTAGKLWQICMLSLF